MIVLRAHELTAAVGGGVGNHVGSLVLSKVARARYPLGPRWDITVVDPPGSRFCEVMSHLRTHLLKGKTHLSHYRAVSSGGDVPGETHLGSREMR